MFFSRKTSRHLFQFALSITLVGLLLAPGAGLKHSRLKVPGTVVHATDSKSYVDFINAAYLGAYGRYPNCAFELEPEFYNMVYAASQSALQAECERFVSTLFETQDSYDAQNLTTYTQTYEYQARNPDYQTGYSAQESYVSDLYYAFLQRAPDSPGLAYWTDDVMREGRKKGIVAFDACGEFEDLVANLYEGSAPDCCTLTCGYGEVLDEQSCTCVGCIWPNCYYY
jgi:hypothetical protein